MCGGTTWCLTIIPWWTLDHHKPGSCGCLWTSLCVDVHFGFSIFSVPIFRRVTQLQVGGENSSIRGLTLSLAPPPPPPQARETLLYSGGWRGQQRGLTGSLLPRQDPSVSYPKLHLSLKELQGLFRQQLGVEMATTVTVESVEKAPLLTKEVLQAVRGWGCSCLLSWVSAGQGSSQHPSY